MKIMCSYCREIYGEKPPLEDTDYTHGICKECYSKETWKLNKLRADDYLVETMEPSIVLNKEGRIISINNKMLRFLRKNSSSDVEGLRGGEAFGCKTAFGQNGGCGCEEKCLICPVRGAVGETFSKQKNLQSVRCNLETKEGPVSFIVDTFYKEEEVVLIITKHDI